MPEIIGDYKIEYLIGQGSYGCVYKAYNLITKEDVALKFPLLSEEEQKDGIQSTTLREMSILKLFQGTPHIIQYVQNEFRLREVIFSSTNAVLVFEYIQDDLKSILDKKALGEGQAKLYTYHILKAVEKLHQRSIFHRDIKPANILISKNEAILGDFGLAKPYGHPIDRTHTKEVQTLWYRAPELLLGNFKYSSQLDIWSIGCIFFEMVFGFPLFSGSSEIDQLFKIFRLLGTPLEWQTFSLYPYYSPKFPQFKSQWFKVNLSPLAKSLLRQMLQIDPVERINASEALQHPYFDDLLNQ